MCPTTRADDCNIELWYELETKQWVASVYIHQGGKILPTKSAKGKTASAAVSALLKLIHIKYP